MSKYPHLSNVLNQEFDAVSKNEEIVGIKQVVEQLQKVVDMMSANAEKEKQEAERIEAREKAEESSEGAGLTPEDLEEAREKSKAKIDEYRATIREQAGKLQGKEKPKLSLNQRLEETRQRQEAKLQAIKDRKEEKRRAKLEQKIADSQNQRMQETRKKLQDAEKQPNVNDNASENFTSMYNKRFKSRFKKSENDEFDWFSSVRV